MIERRCENWKNFELRLDEFFAKRPIDRDRFVFRGHADSSWSLSTTLDRYRLENGIKNREEARLLLLQTFRDQASGLAAVPYELEETTVPLLARHHGLPSTIMDWTRSPYVATFFAFRDQVHDSSPAPEAVAIWCLDLQEAIEPFGDNVDIIDDRRALALIPRAIEQRSVFIDVRHPFDMLSLPNPALRKFVLPTSERHVTLARLEGMGLDERSLFRSLDGAAEVAAWRVRAILKERP